jgi:hypothetical protein
MRLQKLLYTVLTISLVLCPGSMLSGRDKDKDKPIEVKPNPAWRIPGLAGKHLMALGKRMNSAGREKTTYTGQFFDRNGKAASVRVVHDVSGLVRLEGFGDREEVLSFDGKKAKSSSEGKKIRGDSGQKADEDLLEVFVMDTVEGMMESMRKGAAVQFLGSGFRPDPRIEPDYKGPSYDIYEVTTTVRCRRDQLVRTKRYYFDSNTGLLLSTRYYDRSGKTPIKMETRYSVWGDIDGSKYPARIEHYADGKLQFDFIAENIKNAESADKSEY